MIVTTIPNGKLIYQRISTIFHFINMNLPPTDEREKTVSNRLTAEKQINESPKENNAPRWNPLSFAGD